MLLTCVPTVRGEIVSAVPISAVGQPVGEMAQHFLLAVAQGGELRVVGRRRDMPDFSTSLRMRWAARR